jgi:hypothetical protein
MFSTILALEIEQFPQKGRRNYMKNKNGVELKYDPATRETTELHR